MKDNLSNRPRNEKFLHGSGKRTCYAKYEDWFEAFEKELLEALNQLAFTTTMVRNIGTGHKKKLWVSVDEVKRLVLGVEA